LTVKLVEKKAIEWQQTFGGTYADELKKYNLNPFDGGYLIGGHSNRPFR
jgi:hypothetical protein